MADVDQEWSSFAAGRIFTFCVVAASACGGGSSTTLDAPMIMRTITVAVGGNGTGTVMSTPVGLSCPSACTLTVADGAAVTLTATAVGGSTFAGWSGGSCIGTGACTFAAGGDVSINASFVQNPNIVFVTSTTQTGDLGGLAGADDICQARARAAGLPGSYRAWLSTTTVSAISRLGSASGWVRPDGKPVADTAADLAVGKMIYPIRLDENGVDVGETGVMTATTANGTLHPSSTDCSGYTAADDQFVERGQTSAVSSSFTVFGRSSCASAHRMYCFGISNNATVAPSPPISVRRAFITNASWTPGNGLASADNLCSAEASQANLPGTYKALLATSTASAASRFTTADGTAPWARVDGVLLAATPAALFTAMFWDTGMTVLADGTYMSIGSTGVWGGATSLSVAGTEELTCGGTWATTAGTGGGGRNGFSYVSSLFSFDIGTPCTATFLKVVCLQE